MLASHQSRSHWWLFCSRPKPLVTSNFVRGTFWIELSHKNFVYSCQWLWAIDFYIRLLIHGGYVFAQINFGAKSSVTFSSDVFSRLCFVRLRFRSLRFVWLPSTSCNRVPWPWAVVLTNDRASDSALEPPNLTLQPISVRLTWPLTANSLTRHSVVIRQLPSWWAGFTDDRQTKRNERKRNWTKHNRENTSDEKVTDDLAPKIFWAKTQPTKRILLKATDSHKQSFCGIIQEQWWTKFDLINGFGLGQSWESSMTSRLMEA